MFPKLVPEFCVPDVDQGLSFGYNRISCQVWLRDELACETAQALMLSTLRPGAKASPETPEGGAAGFWCPRCGDFEPVVVTEEV